MAAKRDIAVHINEVFIIGRATEKVAELGGGKMSRLKLLVPAWDRDKKGRGWIPFPVDIFDNDARASANGIEPGAMVSLFCRLADRKFKNDEGDNRTLKVLQHDAYRHMGHVNEDVDDVNNPPGLDVCGSRVLLAGRNFIRKSFTSKGITCPPLRDKGEKKSCVVTLTYQDPFQPQPEGDEYFKDQFFDIWINNGQVAETVSKFCRRRSQIVVRGELGRRQLTDDMVKGRAPKDNVVSLVPGGFSFTNLDGSGGGAEKKPKPTVDYDQVGVDDDIPF